MKKNQLIKEIVKLINIDTKIIKKEGTDYIFLQYVPDGTKKEYNLLNTLMIKIKIIEKKPIIVGYNNTLDNVEQDLIYKLCKYLKEIEDID